MLQDLGFHPAVASWFAKRFSAPTDVQRQGWAAISSGRNVLIAAPTGAGKTLTAFLWAIDELAREAVAGTLGVAPRVLYISPLKALSNDIDKNLAEPLSGVHAALTEMGIKVQPIRSAVRTGDTPQKVRRAMITAPPHILVSTPESFYVLLGSESGRALLKNIRTVIVDEIHAVASNRRGSHLALSLERLDALTERPVQRIGLSATQKPIEEIAKFLVGAAKEDCEIVDAGYSRARDLAIEMPLSPLAPVMSNEVWSEVYERVTELVKEHRTTLVFVNARRMCERVAYELAQRLPPGSVTSHHGSLSTALRLDAEQRLKRGELKALVATSSLELGLDIGDVDLVIQIGVPRTIATFLQRIGRAGHWHGGIAKGRLFPLSRDELVESVALLQAVRAGELDRIIMPERPLDVLAQQIVAAAVEHAWLEDDLFALFKRAHPFRNLTRVQFDEVVHMLAQGYATQRGRRGALLHYDAVNKRLRARDGARLASITSGGTIPENADFTVRVEPEGIVVGSVNEDFAIESMAGDVFKLGQNSWRILQVVNGSVRVEDAHGAPPSIPFWLGEAPARSEELSEAVSNMRAAIADKAPADARAWVAAMTGVGLAAAEQAVAYVHAIADALGVVPTIHTIVAERFFDAAGGMQLVLHAPFGSRINRAWGLALRKRFCRAFNVELQAAATEDAIVISLSTHHSFPLADVFKFVNVRTVRDVLVQALLDAPMFQVRWRWNAGRALAVLRQRGSRRIPAQVQRVDAEEFLGAAFPDQVACLENIVGERKVPDHPLVTQTVDDCLHEAMDLVGLCEVLKGIESGAIQCVTCDRPSPSPSAYEILNAKPYAFLDDAPLEERRTRLVSTRNGTTQVAADSILDPAAVARVVADVKPTGDTPDALHDALMLAGVLRSDEVEAASLAHLLADGRATWAVVHVRAVGDGLHTGAFVEPELRLIAATERRREVEAAYPGVSWAQTSPVPQRYDKLWLADDAIREIVRGRLEIDGPVTAEGMASRVALNPSEVLIALHALEAEGVVLRGAFTGAGELEWCDRRLLARMHRLTLGRLRAEIEPLSAAAYMRYLFAWQRVDPDYRVRGTSGLTAVVRALDGVELPCGAWDAAVLPARVDDYDQHDLDALCTSGLLGWGRLGTDRVRETHAQLTKSSNIALFLCDSLVHWQAARPEPSLSEHAAAVRFYLEKHGASFAAAIGRACSLLPTQLEAVLGELVAAGCIASDTFSGLRDLVASAQTKAKKARRGRGLDRAGRWSLIVTPVEPPTELVRLDHVEAQARVILARYGVVCRRVIEHETLLAPWRDIVRILRRMEARGEVRGGYFVSGMSGEQYALPEALTLLRRYREPPAQNVFVALSAADPLNFTGTILAGERIPAIAAHRILFCNAVPVAVLEGHKVRTIGNSVITAEAEKLLVQSDTLRGKSMHALAVSSGRFS
ncbi:MAG: DEAD/DEAH box helicase [Clostridia bacterium]|nr:DEAD/DEAH box helicase [Deltaproteobacteria bacterium]